MTLAQYFSDPVDLESQGQSMPIPSSAVHQVLQGFCVATKIPDEERVSLKAQVLNRLFEDDLDHTVSEVRYRDLWSGKDDKQKPLEMTESAFEAMKIVTNAILAIAFLREMSRQNKSITSEDLESIWSMIKSAIMSQDLKVFNAVFSATRSAQGFLAIPLCSLINDGNIEELFRLHVWLPDGKRGDSNFSIHSHQPFAQSWILAGEGRDHSYDIAPATNFSDATHAEYTLNWTDSKGTGASYRTHQTSSVVTNTGRLVRATETRSTLHTSGGSWWQEAQYMGDWRDTKSVAYSIPAGSYHSSHVFPDILHSTIFYFDSSRGFIKDARVLGPKDGESFVQERDPAGITPSELASSVDAVRNWEFYMSVGKFHSQRSDWELALKNFHGALSECEFGTGITNMNRYNNDALSGIANTSRRFGRYHHARDILIKAIEGIAPPSRQSAEFYGELGVVYRHMNLLGDARQAFEMQYSIAKQLNLPRAMCRSIGNIGMVNYQLFQQKNDPSLLDLAILQLTERVERACRLPASINWQSIGLARLSLCYSARGDAKLAIKEALASLELLQTSTDPTVIAMTRFFYGRALLLDGQREAALVQFNPRGDRGGCTPAIALCKEPSDEHRGYLKELVEAGANMELIDEHGYAALDYAVFNGDVESEALVLEGLRRQVPQIPESTLKQLKVGARLRKGYREIFQEKLRPLLMHWRRASMADAAGPKKRVISYKLLHGLRDIYATTLAGDPTKAEVFDVFKYVPYEDFLRLGKLPCSTDGVATAWHKSAKSDDEQGEVVIFFSYRWLNKDQDHKSPDDKENTQYKRMVAAVEEFLALHPEVPESRLKLWIDHACVDQANPLPGVNALPMLLAQCDAIISLVNHDYYDRAWCAVEIMMAQVLRKAYGLHQWYEQVEVPETGDDAGANLEASTLAKSSNNDTDIQRTGERDQKRYLLREAPDTGIEMATKLLTYEEDRAKVLFLERQSRLLA